MQTLRQFEIVEALALHRHFGRAAAALGVSQPSLTRSLNRIEEAFGAALFERAGVTPTAFGAIVLKHGRLLLTNFAELSRELSLAKGLDIGELTIAVGLYPADISGYRAAALLSERRPNVSVEIRVMDWPRAKEAVLAGAVDLAFADIRVASEAPDFDVRPVRAGPLCFFASTRHPLAHKRQVEFDDLTRFPWVGPSLTPAISAALPQDERPNCVFDKASGRLRPRILVESFDAVKQVVRGGKALSACVPFQIEAEVAAGEFMALPAAGQFIGLDYGFVLKRGRVASPAAEAFMEIVRAIEDARGP